MYTTDGDCYTNINCKSGSPAFACLLAPPRPVCGRGWRADGEWARLDRLLYEASVDADETVQEQYRLTYTSLQDLADQCAARQDDYNARTAGSGFPTSATFALGMVINNCFLSATLSGAGPCDASNLVQYVPSN